MKAKPLKVDLKTSTDVMHNLFIWKKNAVPNDCAKGLIVKLPTKAILESDNRRGITLLSIPSKVFC
jgi:hypothetical protein